MNVVAVVLHVAALAALSYRVVKKYPGERYVAPALAFKLLAGILLGLLYKIYYASGDTFRYFQDAVQLAGFARHDLFGYLRFLWSSDHTSFTLSTLALVEPRALFLTKIVSIFCLLTAGNYWITALYFSFFSFVGSLFLVQRIKKYFPSLETAAVIAFLFFPSFVFWSAGVIKESLAMACLYFLSGLLLMILFSDRPAFRTWFLTVISAWILWKLKYYFATAFFAVAITLIVHKLITHRFNYALHPLARIGLWFALLILPVVVASLSRPNFHPGRFLEVIAENYEAYQRQSAAEDVAHYPSLRPTIQGTIKSTPRAFVTGLFRPFVWEAGNLLQVLAGIENFFILAVFLAACYRWRPLLLLKDANALLIVALVTYVFSLCIFIGLSTPNFGTLSRYRVGYEPYFVLLILAGSGVHGFLQRSVDRLVRDKA